MDSIITVTTPATTLLLASVDDLKAEIGVESTDNTRFYRYMRSASAQVCRYLSRQIASETVSETFRRGAWSKGPLNLSRFPVSNMVSVTEDGTVLASTAYELDAAAGQLWRLDTVGNRTAWCGTKTVIAYVGGYLLPGMASYLAGDPASLPDDIATAAIRLASMLYFSREREPGLKSEIVPGVIERQYWDLTAGTEDAANLPPDVRAMLDPYRVPMVA